jgi:Peptidase family M1 domain
MDTPPLKGYLHRLAGGMHFMLCLFPRPPVCLACAAILLLASSARAEIPPWLPHYDVNVRIDVDCHQVLVGERVRWTNPHQTPTNKIVFNAHSHYSVPDKDVAFLAKMLEILRMAPKDGLDFNGPPLNVQSVQLIGGSLSKESPAQVAFCFQKDNDTALEVSLPFVVGPGESVTLELEFMLRLPQKQGRWGQWKGVTFLAQWLPVVAVYDDTGWQPTPFIPWHQPFFNEAGIYNVQVALPSHQKLAASSAVQAVSDLGNGWQQVELAPTCVRDFALFCSADFQEFTGQAGDTQVRVLALPGHEWYAQEMVKIAEEAIPVYNQWFGPYPYPQFTVVESYFGWNGNECGSLVMIDQRIFGLPHVARNFVDALLTHEICHQWWYNLVGTNGYAETWMDEGPAVHFSNELIDQKLGKNNKLLAWPDGLEWLPNIHRDDYNSYTMLGCMARGEASAVVQPMPDFGHLVNLMAMTYDRGGRILGMIEDRLGKPAFFDFMKHLRCKYEYRIMRVADFQHELELYTGQSWEEFFQNWLYKPGMTDWAVESVKLERQPTVDSPRTPLSPLLWREENVPHRATIVVRQKGQCQEPTVLGIRLDDGDGYQLRIPIVPGQQLDLEEFDAHVVPGDTGTVVVDILLPRRPRQIAVDPDKVLLDSNPTNNTWKPEINCRIVPIYTQLEETDVTNASDRWNFIAGPWIYGSSYNDPWYTRSDMVGFRAGVYRTQEFAAGTYIAYRTDDRNFVAGADALWDHCLIPHLQIGFNVERSLTTLDTNDQPASRGVLFARYVLMYGDSLYLPPFHYVEAYGAALNHNLPNPDPPVPDVDPFTQQSLAGVHYHINFLTPYWDPEGGFALDATYQQGFPIFGEHQWSEQGFAQFSCVKSMPESLDWLRGVPGLSWLMDTRWALRLHAAAALPQDGLIFPFGGSDLFRGYYNAQREGSLNWIASLEWRVPLWQDIEYQCCDHIATAKNLYAAFFCDTGNSYINGHPTGPVAYATGIGLRLDVSWFGLIERTMLSFDVAKTINDCSPFQFWFGIQHPF